MSRVRQNQGRVTAKGTKSQGSKATSSSPAGQPRHQGRVTAPPAQPAPFPPFYKRQPLTFAVIMVMLFALIGTTMAGFLAVF